MAGHDEDIGALKSRQESQEKRLDGIDGRLSALGNKVDQRYEEGNRQYKKIVWGLMAGFITYVFGPNLLDAIMRGPGKS